jgi:hypothetical protein
MCFSDVISKEEYIFVLYVHPPPHTHKSNAVRSGERWGQEIINYSITLPTGMRHLAEDVSTSLKLWKLLFSRMSNYTLLFITSL